MTATSMPRSISEPSTQPAPMRVEATSASMPYWPSAVPLKRGAFIQPGSGEWNSELGWFAKTKDAMSEPVQGQSQPVQFVSMHSGCGAGAALHQPIFRIGNKCLQRSN